MTQRFKMVVEYDGRPFSGFQRQKTEPSVQATIESAIERTTGEQVTLQAAGRTDAGVHARAQVVHADIEKSLTPFQLTQALNYYMRPKPVGILDCSVVSNDFHARFSAKGRAYDYIIVNRRTPLTFEEGLAWQVIPELDANAMHDAAQILVGTHDFTTFRHSQCQSKSPVKTLDHLSVSRRGERLVVRAAARSFLHHQIRSITGTLKLVGEGRWSAADVRSALAARDRRALGMNAPPYGLYFTGVDY